MLPRQKLVMIIVCIFIFIFIIDLVRRRRLREEYSWLWLLTSASMFILVIKYNWLGIISNTIGAVLPTTTLFIGSLIFLMILSVQFSVRISRLTDQVKNLVQENALLRDGLEELKKIKIDAFVVRDYTQSSFQQKLKSGKEAPKQS